MIETSLASSIDPAALAELSSISSDDAPDVLASMIRIYLENAPRRQAALVQALACGDLTAVAAVAHALRGSSGIFGAGHLTRLCQQLEEHRRDGIDDGILALVQQIVGELERVSSELRALLADGPAGT